MAWRASSASAAARWISRPGKKQREFLAAITGDKHGLFERDQRQRLADRAQAGIAGDVAVTIVEQLEVIDIDHHQRQRRAAFGGLLPFALDLAVEAAAVGKAAETVEACQLVEMPIGDLQFFLARGELGCHVVKRCGERRKFGNPGLLRRAHMQIAAAEARRGAHQRADRPHHQLLAAEPGDEQNEQAEHDELQIGDIDLVIDAGMHGALVETDGEPRLRPRHAHIGENPLDAVESRRPSSCRRHWRAFPASIPQSAKRLPIKAC